jgi:superfamily II DNA/RNA helicase
MSFNTLGINPAFTEALASKTITEPSPVQKLVIPKLFEYAAAGSNTATGSGTAAGPDGGRGLFFSSPTGTGKTFAYLLPLLQSAEDLYGAGSETSAPGRGIRGPILLVLAPTLELCSQIKTELDFLLKHSSLPPEHKNSALLIGSVSLSRQIEALKKNHPKFLVGNPARILQLVKMKKLSLSGLVTLVLDEGDRLMADELVDDTAAILSLIPRTCGIIACSATMPEKHRERIKNLAGGESGARQWDFIEDRDQALRENMEHWAFFAEDRRKVTMLRSFIAAARPKKLLVFTSRAGQVGNIVSQLQFHHLAAGGISGDMEKKARKAAMDGFRSGSLRILVASDLAARGLDIAGLTHIVALDVPDNPEIYIHRSGRTARAGKKGIMASIGNEEEMRCLAAIEKKLGIVVYPKELYGGAVVAPEASA